MFNIELKDVSTDIVYRVAFPCDNTGGPHWIILPDDTFQILHREVAETSMGWVEHFEILCHAAGNIVITGIPYDAFLESQKITL